MQPKTDSAAPPMEFFLLTDRRSPRHRRHGRLRPSPPSPTKNAEGRTLHRRLILLHHLPPPCSLHQTLHALEQISEISGWFLYEKEQLCQEVV
ncbi:unnamed protein product [Camellia sinensis]